MKRKFLLNAIDELKNTDNIESAIDALKDLAVNFCDNLMISVIIWMGLYCKYLQCEQ